MAKRTSTANRRGAARWALAVAVAAPAAALAFGLPSCTPGRRPDVVLLVMDTTRADRCSFVGSARATTPNLDAFARDAVVFRDAWTPGCWTGPAHATLFTGLRPEHHGYHAGSRGYLGEEFTALAQRMQSAGYATACFTNNEWVSPEYGMTRGFETFEPLYVREDRPYPWARETHTRAAQWVRREHDAGRPVFLFVNDMEPHMPFTPDADLARRRLPPPAAQAEVEAARELTPKDSLRFCAGMLALGSRDFDILSALYDAEIETLDREIGVLLEDLRESGVLDRALVVVLGDHGESLGEHGTLGHGHDLHASILHVPLLVRYPGGRSANTCITFRTRCLPRPEMGVVIRRVSPGSRTRTPCSATSVTRRVPNHDSSVFQSRPLITTRSLAASAASRSSASSTSGVGAAVAGSLTSGTSVPS
jgi:arylsulfatase A-like enzyme